MNNERLAVTIELYDNLESQLSKVSKQANFIENTVLVISVVTSGGLWLLAGEVLPQPVTWAGAALSTVVSGLTLYSYSSGVNKKRQKAITLHAEISKFLAKVRGNAGMSDQEFWDTYKDLEHRTRTLDYEKD